MTHAETKKRLRAEFKAKRRALPPDEAEAAGRAVCARLRGLAAWRSAGSVLLYMPVQNEIDVRPLLDELWERGAKALLPRCRPGEPGVMDVACVSCLEHIRPGAYGILEPDPAVCPCEPGLGADVILVPGLAFDLRGRRLGFGGGYYDRLLACPEGRSAMTIGLAHDFQVVDELPADPWDAPVRALCTPTRYVEVA